MLSFNPIEDFPTAFVKEALNWVGCTEVKSSPKYACFVEIVTYQGKELSLEAWCAKFVWMILDKVSKKFGKFTPLKYNASTIQMKKDAQAKGIAVDKTAVPGSIMFKYRDGGGHVAIVSSVDGNKFQTIDGNSSDKVQVVKRTITETDYYFIHVEKLFENNMLIMGLGTNWVLAAAGLTGGYLAYKKFRKKR